MAQIHKADPPIGAMAQIHQADSPRKGPTNNGKRRSEGDQVKLKCKSAGGAGGGAGGGTGGGS